MQKQEQRSYQKKLNANMKKEDRDELMGMVKGLNEELPRLNTTLRVLLELMKNEPVKKESKKAQLFIGLACFFLGAIGMFFYLALS